MLRDELPDWASMIAANLVIDGILTTWVAGARDSSIEPLAQRARKILQEEGAHRIHAEAWCKRICRLGGDDRALLLQRIGEAWEQAARWPGPDDDAGYREAVASGHARPEARRGPRERCASGSRRCLRHERMRGRARGAAMGDVTCPFCESSDIEDVAQWGGQIITRQARCRSCNTYFEVVREDFDDPPS